MINTHHSLYRCLTHQVSKCSPTSLRTQASFSNLLYLAGACSRLTPSQPVLQSEPQTVTETPRGPPLLQAPPRDLCLPCKSPHCLLRRCLSQPKPGSRRLQGSHLYILPSLCPHRMEQPSHSQPVWTPSAFRTWLHFAHSLLHPHLPTLGTVFKDCQFRVSVGRNSLHFL